MISHAWKTAGVLALLVILMCVGTAQVMADCQTRRIGAVCRDGWRSSATGSGACSHHGGVAYWLYHNPNPSVDAGPDKSLTEEIGEVFLDALVKGGSTPYTYRWSPGGQTTEDITVSVAGTYTLTVTGANGCAVNDSVRVMQAGDTSIVFALLGVLAVVAAIVILLF